MRPLALHDVVVLLNDLPAENLRAGMKGTVVAEFDTPRKAFEVEFADEKGKTVAQVAVVPSQIRRAD